jgi:dolichol-phosphate mannosyltransferase
MIKSPTYETELLVVMPVFNEQASVRKVVNEWFSEIQNWTESFRFLAIDDGSTDRSLEILLNLRTALGDRFIVRSQPNSGHGQTCLRGYREACEQAIPYVFQIDSDGQCDPQYFFRLWRLKDKADVVYGHRKTRQDGFKRVAASYLLRFTLLATAGVFCVDANVPYRFMRTEKLRPVLDRIPISFGLANIALAVLLRKDPAWRHAYVPIVFRERYGGEPSVPLGRFGEKATELNKQLRALLRASA